MSTRRKVAIIFSVLWVIVFFLFLFPAAYEMNPLEWRPIAIMFSIFWGGLACAVLSVEILRNLVSAWYGLDETRHFNRVMILFVFFFALIAWGYRIVVERFGE